MVASFIQPQSTPAKFQVTIRLTKNLRGGYTSMTTLGVGSLAAAAAIQMISSAFIREGCGIQELRNAGDGRQGRGADRRRHDGLAGISLGGVLLAPGPGG